MTYPDPSETSHVEDAELAWFDRHPEPQMYQLALWGMVVTVTRDPDTGMPSVAIDTEGMPATEHNPDGTPRIFVEVNEGEVYDGIPDEIHEAFVVATQRDDYRAEAFSTEAEAVQHARDLMCPGVAVAVRHFSTRTVPTAENLGHIAEEYKAVRGCHS